MLNHKIFIWRDENNDFGRDSKYFLHILNSLYLKTTRNLH